MRRVLPGGCENASPAPAHCLSAWAVPSLPLVRVNSSPRKGPESDFGSRAPRSGPRPRTGGSARPGPVTRYSGNRNWTPRRLHAPQTLVLPAIRAAPGPPWGPRVQARDSGQRPTTAPLPGRQLWAGRGSGQLTYPRDAVPRAAGRGPCGARQSLLHRPGRRHRLINTAAARPWAWKLTHAWCGHSVQVTRSRVFICEMTVLRSRRDAT